MFPLARDSFTPGPARASAASTTTTNMKIKSLAALFLMVLLAGCTSPTGQKFSAAPQIIADKSLVYIYRPSSKLAAANRWRIMANKEYITDLNDGGYFPYYAPPGHTVFSIQLCKNPFNTGLITAFVRYPATDCLTLDIEPGKTYYARFNSFSKSPMSSVEAEKALTELKRCRLEENDPSKMRPRDPSLKGASDLR